MFLMTFLTVPLASVQPYLDPVAQSAIIQTLLAIVLGASLLIRAFWRKIHAFIQRMQGKSEEQPQEAPDQKAE